MVVGTLGFLAAWLATLALERLGLTRHIWHLPLFFVALAVLFGATLGLALSPCQICGHRVRRRAGRDGIARNV
jgi:hypothetical protein